MALNKYMHKRNPFRGKRIDFKELSIKHDFVRDVICSDESNGEIVVDFKSPAHLAVISKALLLDTFNLDVVIPLDRLIPTIPLRMNYILWIEDLLNSSPLKCKKDILVLDIGLGSICIYGLLGARVNKWHFVATDIDAGNVATSQSNVARNKLDDLIDIVTVTSNNEDESILFSSLGSIAREQYFDIVMCNPPFFTSATDKSGCHTTKNLDERHASKSINTGTRTESVAVGGEVEFTQRLIEESISNKTRVGIFTVMLGKKSSTNTIKHYLQSKGIMNHSIYELCQGRVMRWGVAWSFLDDFVHPKSEFQLCKLVNTKCIMSWKMPCDLTGLQEYSVNGVYHFLKNICKKLDITFLEQKNKQADGGGYHLLCCAKRNTWSNQRRKRRELLRQAPSKVEEEEIKEPDCKRMRMEEVICDEGAAMDDVNVSSSNSSDVTSDEHVLRCTMNVATKFDNDLPVLQLDLLFLDGDKESMNQILTYIKNTALNRS